MSAESLTKTYTTIDTEACPRSPKQPVKSRTTPDGVGLSYIHLTGHGRVP